MNSAQEGLLRQQNVKQVDAMAATPAEGEFPPSQILCGNIRQPTKASAVKNGQFVKCFTRY